MPLTMSNYDAVLKDAYEGGIREQLNNDIPLFRLLETSARPWTGRRAVYPMHNGRNSGVGARAENATLPVAGNQGTNLVVVSATYQYGRFRLSGPTIAAGKNAFAEAMAMEMDGLVKDCKVDWGRQTWGTGDGRLAQIGLSASAATGDLNLDVQNRFARPGQPGARFITVGQLIDMGSTVNGSTSTMGSRVVTSIAISLNPATTIDRINISGTAITFSGGGAGGSAMYIYNNGAGGTAGVGLEMMGIQGIVDQFTEANGWGSNAFWSAALFGINRSAISEWNASVLANSGTTRLIDSYLMQQAFDQINIDTGEEADLVMGHHSVVRALFDNLVADRRFASTVYEGGFSKMTYNGVAVEKDRLAPYNSLLVCKRSALQRFVLKDIGFADRDGAILTRIADQDTWEGFLCYYANLGVVGAMKSLVMIRDIRTDL